MITLTIIKKVKTGSIVTFKRELKLFRSMDKAREEITPIVEEMRLAKSQKREPKVRIDAVSYDTKSEKNLLLETRAITSIENEEDEESF